MWTEINQLCPYTGLRAFTEEESLYFKGRDEHINQISALLEVRKFLMLTGASGEGKSSLIYAGLIPNARAGFFKARFSNWTVVDFRPERSPLKSLAKSLAEKLSLNTSSVETELRRGYSSLVDLYVNSSLYIDENDSPAQSETERKQQARRASNLLILADQFEELFTNPENFAKEGPSADAQIMVNLLLETARFALQKELPIYIVCTMRSDYIGQCSAFRGLPEYIGFSQFFVPRLKRKDLKQVIEEPAELIGNHISQRLVERLVYDLSEGIDQLPILQHALRQIWIAADGGKEEMDLIHYAMVGGMAPHELPQTDQMRFDQWFGTLSANERSFYKETGLSKVIEIHADKLYYHSVTRYHAHGNKGSLSPEEIRNAIAVTFSCLTKIDNSRAVRSRMTLQEITDIIDNPKITAEVAGEILAPFREENNAFIWPFISADGEGYNLSPESVLDITHESLIRNWGRLKGWANEEFDRYMVFRDLMKQVERWKSNKKQKGFLLPVGPLTHFENWFIETKPTAGWINRYSEVNNLQIRNETSRNVLNDVSDFLNRSGRSVAVSRFFVKHGVNRILFFAAALTLLVLCGFYWYDAQQKTNEEALRKITKRSEFLLASKEVRAYEKATHLLVSERYDTGKIVSYLYGIEDVKERITLSLNVYMQMLMMDKHLESALKFRMIGMIERDLSTVENDPEFVLSHLNFLVSILCYDQYYNENEKIGLSLKNNSVKLFQLVQHFFQRKRPETLSVEGINFAINLALAFGEIPPDEIQKMIVAVSPFATSAEIFESYYPQGSFQPNGIRPIDFNGGYHMLASLYAVAGDTKGILASFEKMSIQPEYFTEKAMNNYSTAIGFLYQYNHPEKAREIVEWICQRNSRQSAATIYHEMVTRTGFLSIFYRTVFGFTHFTYEGKVDLSLSTAPRSVFNSVANDYVSAVEKISNITERNFLLAMHYKRLGIYQHKYQFDRQQTENKNEIYPLFDRALTYYKSINDPKFLGKKTFLEAAGFVGALQLEMTNQEWFAYPDYRGSWFANNFHSDIFFRYLADKGLLKEMYKTKDDLKILHEWLSMALRLEPNVVIKAYMNSNRISIEALDEIQKFIEAYPPAGDFDNNLLDLELANRAALRNDTTLVLQHFKRLRLERLMISASLYSYLSKNYFINAAMELSRNLASIGKLHESVLLSESLEVPTLKVFSYLSNASKLYDIEYSPEAIVQLDSAFSNIVNRDDSNKPPQWDYRFQTIYVLNSIGGEAFKKEAFEILKEIPEGRKINGVISFLVGLGKNEGYHSALTGLSYTLTESEELNCYTAVLFEASKENERKNNQPAWIGMDNFFDFNRKIQYVFPL